MSNYLNTNVLLENYKNLYRSKYFIDKSLIIDSLNQLLNTSDKYVCITRPRRFGKSSIASMIGAYYSKAVKSKEIFDNLKISSSESYMENLNKYNVISISFNEIPDNMKSYDDYINMIRTQLIRDITEKYTHIKEDKYLFKNIFKLYKYLFTITTYKNKDKSYIKIIVNKANIIL